MALKLFDFVDQLMMETFLLKLTQFEKTVKIFDFAGKSDK